MADAKKVTVGEREYSVAPFRTYKAIRAGVIVSRVTEQVQAILDHVGEFTRQYRTKHTVQITREMCATRAGELRAAAARLRALVPSAPEEIPEAEAGEEERRKTKAELEEEASSFDARAASWDQQLTELGERGHLELPQDPSFEEQLLAAVPKAFELVEQELIQLFALAVIPNGDLKKARRGDGVDAALKEIGEELVDESDIEEMIALAVVVAETLEAQLRPSMEALAKLQRLYQRAAPVAQVAAEGPSVIEGATTSASSAPTSSTSSQPPTDGPPSEPSSDSGTERPSLSVSA